jgi:hypothetical protein
MNDRWSETVNEQNQIEKFRDRADSPNRARENGSTGAPIWRKKCRMPIFPIGIRRALFL